MDLDRIRDLIDGGYRDWSLNANEVSGWVRLGAPFLLWIGSLRRSFRNLLGVLAFVAVSPYVFSPSSEDRWMNRAMRGEQVWALRRPHDLDRLLNIGGGVTLGLSLIVALFRKFWVSLLLLVVSNLLTAWHFDRMAASFEMERDYETLQDDGEDIVVDEA